MRRIRRHGPGFTTVELIITMAIIAVLASMAVPRFGTMIRKANEASTLGKLATLRRSVSVYYADKEGQYPGDLTPFLQPGGQYATPVLPLYTADHGALSTVNYAASIDPTADTGALGYIVSGADAGKVWMQCTHTDVKGTIWSSY